MSEKKNIHLLSVVGTRPQIIKSEAILRAACAYNDIRVEVKSLHTGQHYDANMSQVFFDELGIPLPDYNLGVGSGRHGEQTAKIIAGIEEVLLSEPFDGIILYGDTNSTLAGAVAASKLHVPVFHIEAGLRSFNMAMPEEVNRIVCDQLSSICFAPTQTAVDNLQREGFNDSRATFRNGKKRLISLSGDVMYDNSLHFAQIARQRSKLLHELELEPNGYVLATIHRDNNTDNPERLSAILTSLSRIAQQDHIPVVMPLHPRTKARIEQLNNSTIQQFNSLTLISPASFLDMTLLEQSAKIVMTDSGGVQKEAFFFEKPCIILRPETEWVEIVEHGAGIIADADSTRIEAAYRQLINREVHFPPLFGDGHAAELILSQIFQYMG
ncbi:MAG: UDP-N-acetylglucosamine 2-epimerase (non-hydrolyzing) [Bacteroidales bacterium]|nr:UDP-N-acetylglucosamine 2-epimerase (non-hydrolyzing) [Bacteroidales bacterium]